MKLCAMRDSLDPAWLAICRESSGQGVAFYGQQAWYARDQHQ
jgi:hypothetical protein